MAKGKKQIIRELEERFMTISKLHKVMKQHYQLFDFILNGREFPDFKSFVGCSTSVRPHYSISDGILMLIEFARSQNIIIQDINYVDGIIIEVNNRSINMSYVAPNAQRAHRQTQRALERDKNGLLGITVSRPKSDKKTGRTIRSVWTVKK